MTQNDHASRECRLLLVVVCWSMRNSFNGADHVTHTSQPAAVCSQGKCKPWKSTRCVVVVISAILLLAVFTLESITSWNGTRSNRLPQPIRSEEQMTSDEVHHVIFVKVHKAASTTVMNVFIRFAMSRDLYVMFPRTGNILSNRFPELSPIIGHPVSPPFQFDILCNHVILNIPTLQPYFPPDTKYVAILREPWDLVQSAYHYFRDVEDMPYLQAIPSFIDYISNPLSWEPQDPLQSFTMNRMSIDLGLPSEDARNASHTADFVRHLHGTLHLVLIAERFEESMVLLKRYLRWRTKDVLFMMQNQHEHVKLKSDEIPPGVKKRFEKLNHHDVAIYRHFSRVFQKKVEAEGTSFVDEVKSFSEILETVRRFCISKALQDTLTINATRWNAHFEVHQDDCALMMMDEINLVDEARRIQWANMLSLYPELKQDGYIVFAVFSCVAFFLVLLSCFVYQSCKTQPCTRIK